MEEFIRILFFFKDNELLYSDSSDEIQVQKLYNEYKLGISFKCVGHFNTIYDKLKYTNKVICFSQLIRRYPNKEHIFLRKDMIEFDGLVSFSSLNRNIPSQFYYKHKLLEYSIEKEIDYTTCILLNARENLMIDDLEAFKTLDSYINISKIRKRKLGKI